MSAQRALSLPHPPGQGPFRTKGVVFIGVRNWYSHETAFGYDRPRAALNSDVAAFLDQRFLAASWYDYLPLFLLYRETAKLSNKPIRTIESALGRHSAERDLHGVYKFLLKLTSPHSAMSFMPRVWHQYFSFGSAEVVPRGPSSATFIVHGFPSDFAEDFEGILEGWIAIVLEYAGAADVVSEPGKLHPDGRVHGVGTSRIEIPIRWR